MWHPDTQTPKPPNKPPNPSPKRTATKQLNTMAWPVQRTHFWTTFPPAPGFGQALKVSLQNTLKTSKNHGFDPLLLVLWDTICTWNWLRDAPSVVFGRHTWPSHDFAPKRLPKTRASKQGNSMAWPVQRTHFSTTFPPDPGAKRHVWIH